MTSSGLTVFTIGHSTHTLDEFVALLRRHWVTAVADVRAAPYSRFNPQFRRGSLADGLGALGLEYVFLGRELGGVRPTRPTIGTAASTTAASAGRSASAAGSSASSAGRRAGASP